MLAAPVQPQIVLHANLKAHFCALTYHTREVHPPPLARGFCRCPCHCACPRYRLREVVREPDSLALCLVFDFLDFDFHRLMEMVPHLGQNTILVKVRGELGDGAPWAEGSVSARAGACQGTHSCGAPGNQAWVQHVHCSKALQITVTIAVSTRSVLRCTAAVLRMADAVRAGVPPQPPHPPPRPQAAEPAY